MSCFSCDDTGTGTWCQYCTMAATAAIDCFGVPIESGRRGTWIQTVTGRKFWPLSPRPADIDIEDIATGLSRECRYGKQTQRFYSVAEHSLIVSTLVAQIEPRFELEALLHDCDEAYLPDMPRPLKHEPGMQLEVFRSCGALIQSAAFARFGVVSTSESHGVIDAVDKRLVRDEIDQLMRNPDLYLARHGHLKPTGYRIAALEPTEARDAFLQRFSELTKEHM